ncbi:MAG: DUF305 domain-containing protein [Janthinobacterium lividum]
MRTATHVGALGAATALFLTLAACGGGDSASMNHSSTSSTSTSSNPTTSAPVEAEHNDHDVMFAQLMLVHHQGAIEMAEMAVTRAADTQVKDLATTIAAVQQPEIDEMTSWLSAWGDPGTAEDPSMPGMDHSATDDAQMPGMMSQAQTTELGGASGADFDRMFLQMMIEHHTGAVQMAQTEQQQGQNTQALELADSIVMSQNAEIDQMNQLLATI